MTTHNTTSTLSANWKEVYGDAVENLIPESAVLSKEIPFNKAKKLGDKFIQPVQLSHEHGITYIGPNGGVAALETAEAAVYKEAQVDSSELLLRSSISYNAADKMASSKESFLQWSEMLVDNMTSSIAKRNEIAMLYGQTGIGTVSAVNDSSGTNVLTLSDFCDGIWAGMEGARLDVFTGTTLDNTNAVLVVSAVDFDAGTVTVTGNSTDTAGIAANDVLYFRGANNGSGDFDEMAGIDRIITNSGSLFNISAATYGLWKGISHPAGSAALTMGKIFSGVAKAQARGLESDCMVLVNPKTYANLNSDQSALRRYDSSWSMSKNESGNAKLCFYAGTGAKLEVVSHLYCKPTEAFALPKKDVKRIGATDVTFKLPNAAAGGDVFLHLPDSAGYEIRCRSNQAIFIAKPARAVKFTGVVNS